MRARARDVARDVGVDAAQVGVESALGALEVEHGDVDVGDGDAVDAPRGTRTRRGTRPWRARRDAPTRGGVRTVGARSVGRLGGLTSYIRARDDGARSDGSPRIHGDADALEGARVESGGVHGATQRGKGEGDVGG